MDIGQKEILPKPPATSSIRETEGNRTMIYDVVMHTYKKLDIPSSDNKTYVVKTVGVNGCDAILIWRVDPEGREQILLTHFPPTEVEAHRRIIKDFSPRGDGKIKAVFLTMGNERRDWVVKLKEEMEQILKIKPEIISLAGLPKESLKEMQHNPILYQLYATKGYNGNPNARRVIIPFPNNKNIYESQF